MTKEETLMILKDRYNKVKERPDSSKFSTMKKIAREIRKLEKELS